MAAAFLGGCLACSSFATEPKVLRLGLMAFTQEGSFTTYNREDDFILRTLPSLLSEKLPDYQIEMQVLRTHELVALARNGEIDIVFGSSGCFASLIPDGIYALATLVTKSSPDPNAAVAGALIVRADRRDLQTIEDLKGKRAIGGITGMFFNYQMPISAVVDRGYDPEDFFGVLRQVDYPVLKTLEAVKNGRADVGLIRACTLEELPPDEQKLFRVIEPVADSPLRCAHTSRTFPNWTVGAMSHVPSEVAKKITASLLEMPAQTSAGIAWSIANSFSEIDGLFKSLKFGRYEYLRHWTFERFWSVSWPFVMAGLIALLGLLLHLSRVRRLVAQRTAELRTEMANREELEKHNAVITGVSVFLCQPSLWEIGESLLSPNFFGVRRILFGSSEEALRWRGPLCGRISRNVEALDAVDETHNLGVAEPNRAQECPAASVFKPYRYLSRYFETIYLEEHHSCSLFLGALAAGQAGKASLSRLRRDYAPQSASSRSRPMNGPLPAVAGPLH